MKATLKNYRQSPRKVRLITRELRGQNVAHALALLCSVDKKASLPLQRLIASAVANAGTPAETLKIQDITVNQGMTLKRYRPRAFGRAFPLRKRSSSIHISLAKSE